MNNFKPQDSKREEFRKYLERTGAIDVITKIFTNLYEEQEKPSDALAYIYKALADDRPDKSQATTISEERAKIKSLEMELAEAKARIQELEELAAGKNDQEETEETPSMNSATERPIVAQDLEEATPTTVPAEEAS